MSEPLAMAPSPGSRLSSKPLLDFGDSEPDVAADSVMRNLAAGGALVNPARGDAEQCRERVDGHEGFGFGGGGVHWCISDSEAQLRPKKRRGQPAYPECTSNSESHASSQPSRRRRRASASLT